MRLRSFGIVAGMALGLVGCKAAESLLPEHVEDPEEVVEVDAALPDAAPPDTAPPDTPVDRTPDRMPDTMPDARPVDTMPDKPRDTGPDAPCGKVSQPCCGVIVNGDPATACPGTTLRCSVTKTCLTCGGSNQPCCRAV